jgi:signal transduction histidine kinase
LDAAEEQVGPDESLERAKSNLGEAIAAARSLSVDLFPPVLQNHGLPEALEWLASWMHKKYQKEIIVEAAEAANPETQNARILTFESVRELIFNSVKYAEVPVVQVKATLTPDDEVCVEVSDNGCQWQSKFPHLR